MKRLVVGLLILYGAVCAAQTPLYRGRDLTEYDFPFNGHYFWSTPDFRPGTVRFNGATYEGVSININAHTQDLLVKETQFSPPVVAERALVPWFDLDGVRYRNLRLAGIAGAPEGFFQEFSDSRGTVWMQRSKIFARETGDHNGVRGIGYDDPNYREKLLAYFHQRDRWYAVRNGKFRQIHVSRRRRAALSPVPGSPSDDVLTDLPKTLVRPVSGNGGEAWRGLPAGWFADGSVSDERSALLAAIEQEKIIASYRNKTYEIGTAGLSEAPFTVSGAVHDVASGEALSAVLVSDSSGRIFCYTDSEGRYELKLPAGENVLRFSEYSLEDMNIRVIIHGAGTLDIMMREKVTALRSAYVTANGMADHRRTSMGLETIDARTVTHIPSAFGEGDVLKAMLTLPGVKSVGEASSGFNVRGGSSDQNLILFNGGTIYNPSHLFGIFSAFNTDVIEDIELYKSSIPVRFGGRISSVLDISSREGNNERIKGSLGIGVMTSHLSLEGPLVKDKTTFVLGARTTYSDWILKRLPRTSGYSGGSASFSDVNLGVTHHIDSRNTLQAFGYWSADGFGFSVDTTFNYSNLDVALKWKHLWNDKDRLEVSAGFDRYSNRMQSGMALDTLGAYSLATRIRQGFLRAHSEHHLGTHTLSFGGEGIFYSLSPGTLGPVGSSLVIPRSLQEQRALEPSLYAGDLWQPEDSPFSVEGGVRLSGFVSLQPSVKFYGAPEFRLSGKYSPRSNLSFKAGVNSMNQYIHLISNTSSISPMDTWTLSGENLKPQTGWQAAAGAYWTVAGGALDLSAEGYWKQTRNSLDYKSGAVLSMNEHLADALVPTRGRAYGIELMARKQTGRLTGWVSYTWSRSQLREMQDRGIETINGGDWYNAPYDKPHDVKLVGNYKFTHRYSLSFNLDYSTGRPVTVPVGQYYYGNALRLMYSERNAYRIPDYFRLDAAINIEPGHYLKAFTHMSATFGCYNITGRKNAYSVFYTTSGGSGIRGYMVSVFATQVPYVSLNLKF